MKLLNCFSPKNKVDTINIDIIETPKSIQQSREKFKSMDLKIDGKAKTILLGNKK